MEDVVALPVRAEARREGGRVPREKAVPHRAGVAEQRLDLRHGVKHRVHARLLRLLREREQHLLGMSPAPRAHVFSSFLNMVKLYLVGGFAVKSKGVRGVIVNC